ncbi:MAG: carboxylate-amine ligase [Acidobacteria bacterium]|nr:carboxylate-amine ligase [Acidobacteriota bacterium]
MGLTLEEEVRAFRKLQARLAPLYSKVFHDPLEPRSLVVVPSLSMDPDMLAKVTGVEHYEERLLCMLMLLRMPHTRVVYLTSQPVDPTTISYYLHLLPGIPGSHARKRLTLMSCRDASLVPLSQKILDRPRLLERIQKAIGDTQLCHMTCFNVTNLERRLALALDVPIYGCDPELQHLGTKSGSREVFRAAGVDLPDGFERLRDEVDVASALTDLKLRNPELRRAVVKHEEGASREGNAVFRFEGCPEGSGLRAWVANELPKRLIYEANDETWETYTAKLREIGGIVEAWVEGKNKRSPSVQCRINPIGQAEIISTHDQILGGPSGQVFKGCTFPADGAYRLEIQEAGARIADVLKGHGALGRFGIDFVSIPQEEGWRHLAIEINLRKGGTTHTFMTLQFLTDGDYDRETGLYRSPTGQERCYYASDNLQSPMYRGLTPEDLIDISVDNRLHFHAATQQGVVFHLIGALSQFGKLGVVCVADSVPAAEALYHQTVATLDREAERLHKDRE